MAAVVSGTAYQIKGNTLPENWTSSNTWSGNSTTSYFLLNKAENYLQTEEFCQNGITSIVVNARKYGGPSADQLVISVEWIPTTGDAVLLGTVSPSSTSLTNYTIDDLAAVTANTTGSIKLSCKAAASSKGSGLQVLTINYTAGSCGGDDPQPEPQMKTIYCKMEHEWWTEANAAIAAYAWTEGGAANAEFPGVRMAAVENEDNMWKIDLDLALYEKVIFTRTSASGDVANWGAQTEDLVIPTNDNNLFTISTATGCWTDGCKVDGAWSVYGEGGGDTPEPPTPAEKDSIFFVNVSDWAAVRVHLWGGSAAGTEWPGVEMTKEAEQINGHDVYKFVADEGAYANCIFNNNDNGAQTDDLDWNSGKYFYDGTWYAKENIPADEPAQPEADLTQPFTLKFNGTGNAGSDASGAFAADVAAIFTAASAPYVASIETATKVYAGRPISDDNSSVKFGTSSAKGTLEFTLAQAIEVDSIIVNATQYSGTAAEITINGTKFDLTAGNKVPQDCKITPEGEVSTITIEQTGTERIYLRNVRVYPKTQGGGDDPQPEPQMKTIYCKMEHEWWTDANAAIAAYAWTEGGAKNAEFPGVRMAAVENEDNMWKIDLDLALYEKVIFTRTSASGDVANWGAQTEDLTIPTDDKDLFTISTATGCWTGSECKVEGAWSVYGEGGGDTPEPPVAEKDSIFFVNASDWIALRVHLWGGSAAGTEWPGVEMTPVAEKINSYEVFKLIVDKGAYANCIFNNNDHSVQTTDLDWNSGKYFYKDAWYAKEDIPAETPVTTFVGFDVQDGTLGTQLAAGLAKNRVNVTFDETSEDKYSVNLVEGGVEGSFTLGGVVFAYKNSAAGATAWKTYLTYIQPNGKDREVRIPLEAGKQAKVVLYEACEGVLVNGESTNLEAGENILTATADGIILKSASSKPKIQAILPVDAPDQPEELPVVKIAGSWDEGWDQHVMDVAEDSLTASFTMNLEADNYDFKIVKDGKWLSKYGTSGPNGNQYGINRIWNHADHVNIDAEGAPNFYLEADVTGEYTFTWTFADDSLSVDFPEAPAAPKFYVTGNAALVGEEKQWTPGAIPSENDTLVLNLEAEQLYMLKVTLGNDWTHGVLGYDALSEKPTGIIRGEGDDDDNIIFSIAEDGQVKVVYIKGAGEEYTFKMFGNFYVAPVEKDSIFFVNVSDWAAVRVHLWGGSAAGTEWPGVEMTKEAEQINGHDVYKFVADEGAYANCIFNNNDNGAQTDDLDWNSGKYYYVDAWYAKEDIPTVQPEDVVFTVNVPEGTDSVFIAGTFNGWTFEKMNHVEGLQYTITKNIVKDGIEYKYTAGPDWAYVEYPKTAPNRTWAELDEVTAWEAVPQPVVPVVLKDLEIVAEGEWAAEDEKLGVWAWNAIEDEGHWFATAVENEKLMAHIPVNYDKVIVARFAADAELDWTAALAQTADLDFNECAKLYLATAGANWCAPVPAFETHDFFITGNAALVGEELAWNPNAIPVDGTSKVLHLGAGTYEMKIVLDNCGASHCQQWLGCERLSDEQVEGVACSKVGNIEFALAGEEDVTVTVNLTDTIITLTGNFYNIQMVDIRLVLSPEWTMDNAKFAAVTWRDGQEMENDGVFTDWFVGTGDTVVGQIPEDATQIAFARFAPSVETPFMNPDDENFWNHSDKLIIDPSMIYTIMGGNVEGRDFCPGYWGEEPDFIANGYFLLGTFNEWTPSAAYEFGLVDEEGQRKVTAALAVDDHLKVAKFDRGYRVQWFPAEEGDYIVDADHAGSAQDVYFREDYGGADDWHAQCIYVVKNGATAIDYTAIDAKAEKMLRNGMILIIKGDKTYNVMGQIVK